MPVKIVWSEEARTDIRSFDRTTAMFVFDGVYRYATTREGDVKALKGSHAGELRLRIGDYRVFFTESGKILHIMRVRNRREAYR